MKMQDTRIYVVRSKMIYVYGGSGVESINTQATINKLQSLNSPESMQVQTIMNKP